MPGDPAPPASAHGADARTVENSPRPRSWLATAFVRPAFALAAIVLAWTWSPGARAAEGELAASPAWVRPLAIEGRAGTRAAPLGAYGAALDVRATQRLVLSAGVGVGAEGQGELGPRWAVMPRFDVVQAGGAAVAVGLGYSQGRRQELDVKVLGASYTVETDRWEPAHRLDAELSLAYQWPSGVRVRAFGGAGFVLNEATREISTADLSPGLMPAASVADRGRASIYGGLALGGGVASPGADPFPLSLGRWYGWQALVLDTASLVALAVWADRHEAGTPQTERRSLTAGAAVPAYLFGGPAIHFAHRVDWRPPVSWAVRFLIPLAVGAIALAQGSSECEGLRCGRTQAVLIAGGVAALADDALLAWR